MNLYDFITQDELDDLPEDHLLAFSKFVQIAQRRLSEYTSPRLNTNEESEWHDAWDARHCFVNIAIAAAKRLSVPMFAEREVPMVGQFDDKDYRQFMTDLDHFQTQLALDHSLRSRSDSTRLPDKSKDRIRSHLHHLREAIDSANLTDAKKEALRAKVDDFEKALDRSRINLMAVARLTVQIMMIPGALWASYEATTRLLINIQQIVAEAKAVDDEERKLPADPKPYAIAPPRAPEPTRSRDMDDEIPF